MRGLFILHSAKIYSNGSVHTVLIAELPTLTLQPAVLKSEELSVVKKKLEVVVNLEGIYFIYFFSFSPILKLILFLQRLLETIYETIHLYHQLRQTITSCTRNSL